jgi:hypothetical protein
MTNTTALLRKIELQRAASVQEAWEDRRLGADRPMRVWAVHPLLRAGDISGGMFDAALRLSSLLERSTEGGAAGGERVDGGCSDPHARAWDRAVSATASQAALSFVGHAAPTHRTLLVRLFAFPQPTLGELRNMGSYRAKYERVSRPVAVLLGHLETHFDAIDRSYGRAA